MCLNKTMQAQNNLVSANDHDDKKFNVLLPTAVHVSGQMDCRTSWIEHWHSRGGLELPSKSNRPYAPVCLVWQASQHRTHQSFVSHLD
jgi:hypothetical protein